MRYIYQHKLSFSALMFIMVIFLISCGGSSATSDSSKASSLTPPNSEMNNFLQNTKSIFTANAMDNEVFNLLGITTGVVESKEKLAIIQNEVKIDNLCQIAHNVEIGYGTVIAGSTAIAGSCKIGKYVQIGGNCSVGGHINIGDGVKIAGMSGVMRDIEPMAIMAGIPVLPIKKWHRINALLNKMITDKTN